MSARFARRARLLAAATATVLGAAMPLLGGASTAWADGSGGTVAVAPETSAAPAPAPSTAVPSAAGVPVAPAAVHQGEPTVAFLPGTPTTITAGGGPVELDVEMANFTGAAYDGLRPVLGFDNTLASSHQGGGTNLRPEDFTVKVMTGGRLMTLPVNHGSDPVIYADTSSLAQHLDDGRASRFMFEVSLSAKAPADQHDVTVYFGTAPGGASAVRTLHIVRPDAPSSAPAKSAPAKSAPPAATAPTQAAAAHPAAATSPAAVQPAAVQPMAATSPAAVPTTAVPTTAPTAGKQLAFTGGGSSSGLLIGAGGALVVLGAGAVTLAARRRSTARH
ncbi:hypothetical protein OG455_20475 [Kitasatospora sp. NBC_01287]|uniref:hypothetical protein n=1 Tax=Kitasatospora sp. NBC_01287 TaxID=2903573 RepID=UPI00225AE5EC|nr:hypothetical protein [Kitasatospora sp. NBC_01287]MCX4747863.1 hypothetical protein [Kitasatospora sp. NBC_01287]